MLLPTSIKSSTSIFVRVDTPITFNVFVLTSAVLIPVMPVNCEPSPVYEVASTVPVTAVSYTHLTLPTKASG